MMPPINFSGALRLAAHRADMYEDYQYSRTDSSGGDVHILQPIVDGADLQMGR